MFVSTTRLQLESKDFFLYSISENLLRVYYACILEKEFTEMSKTMSLFPRNLQFMGGTGQLQDRITEMHRRREEGYKTQTGRSGKLPETIIFKLCLEGEKILHLFYLMIIKRTSDPKFSRYNC